MTSESDVLNFVTRSVEMVMKKRVVCLIRNDTLLLESKAMVKFERNGATNPTEIQTLQRKKTNCCLRSLIELIPY